MGSVVRRPNGRYRARYRDLEGIEHARDFALKGTAESWLSTTSADLLRGSYIDPKRAETTVREYAQLWIDAQSIRPNTEALYRSHLRNHILPEFGARRLGQVTPTSVRGFTKGLGAKLAPSTVSTAHRILSMLFRSAVADGYLTKSPCYKTAPRTPAKRPVTPLSPDQVTALAASMPPSLEALVYVCAGLGLRQGEALGLTGAHVRFLERRVEISEQLQTLPDGQRLLVAPKTDSSIRTVPLPGFVSEALAGHMALFPLGSSGLVFVNPHGEPWSRSRFGEIWRSALVKAALPRGTRLHDLRHTYAALLIAAGEHPKVIQSRLGHSSITETMDTYGHLFPESETTTRDALDSAFSGAIADKARTSGVPHEV